MRISRARPAPRRSPSRARVYVRPGLAAAGEPAAATLPAEAAGPRACRETPMVGTFYRSSAPGAKPFV